VTTRSKRLLLMAAAVLVIGVISLLGIISYQHSRQQLTVNFTDNLNAVVSVYAAIDDGTPHPTRTKGGVVAVIHPNMPITIAKGPHILVVSGANLSPLNYGFVLGSTPANKHIDISYTQDYLNRLVPNANAEVIPLIQNQYSQVSNLYTINSGKLYGEGDWYGTTLTYKGPIPDNRDSLRIVAHKENGVWKLATPVLITVSAISYPNIPRYVLVGVNVAIPLPAIGSSPGAIPR
jgi:hypothetical protein